MSIIEDAKKGTLESTAKMIASQAEGLNSRIMVAAGGAGTASGLTTYAGVGGGLLGGDGTSSNTSYNTADYLPKGALQNGVGFAYATTVRQGSFGYGLQSNSTGWAEVAEVAIMLEIMATVLLGLVVRHLFLDMRE